MYRLWMVALIGPLAMVAAEGTLPGQTLRHVESDPATGSSAAVLVEDVPLIHTPQLLPLDDQGTLVAAGSATEQLIHLLDRLEVVLQEAGSDLGRLAKLNLFVANERDVASIWPVLAQRFATEARPAVSLVVTPLPHGEALVALDGVAATDVARKCWRKRDRTVTLPAGSRIYISGQAEPGALREATRKTLESLSASLRHCGRTDADIVQIKCFLTPMSAVADVQAEIADYYGQDKAPPAVFIEWKSSSPSPIEIELIAAAGPAQNDAAEPLEFLTPPELKASPVFSRIARIHRGGTIYLSDCLGGANAAVPDELAAAFERLKLLLEKTGSDLTHLAKATYYVTDDEINKAHNEIRPKYYDPARPPAASKAMVAATGWPGRRYTMDLIAVPSSRGTPATAADRGFGLRRMEALEGWISLFDGETTLGWKDARVENGSLYGEATINLPRCAMQLELAKSGVEDIQFQVGEQKATTKSGGDAEIDDLQGGILRIDRDVAIRSLSIRPLSLKPLWNGRDLMGWKPISRQGAAASAGPNFRVEGKVLRVVGGPAAIEYEGAQFGDFMLQMVVRTRAVHSNGGLFFRAIPGQFMNGYEAQLHNRCLDNDPARTFRYATGGLDDRQDASRLVSRDFEPFCLTVMATGPRITTWVNGRQVTDWTDEREEDENPRVGRRTKAGAIQIQAHDPATDYEILSISAVALE